MTLRTQIFLFVTLVAVSAVGATAWLSVRLTAGRLERSLAAATEQDWVFAETIRVYGQNTGIWEGISEVIYARFRADPRQQRIRLTTTDEHVIVDTEVLAGRAARPVAARPIEIDPRPWLSANWNRYPDDAARRRRVVEAIAQYRRTVGVATCQTRATSQPAAVERDAEEVPRLVDAENPDLPACRDAGVTTAAESAQDTAMVNACPMPISGDFRCLEKTFNTRISEFSAVPVKLYLGALDLPTLRSVQGPVMFAAGGVIVVALLGTAVIATRIVRPVRALTVASARVSGGEFGARVTVGGSEELVRLATSFNRMAASLEEADERQRRLVADLAHELRTPLANLRGYIEAIRDGVFEPTDEVLASLHEEAILQQRLVDDLQDLALAESGALVYHPADLDLADLVEASARASQAAAEQAGIRLVVAPGDRVPVRVDADRIRQVLGNLLSNAIRHTPAGGSVTLRAVTDGEDAVVTVADTGTGIAEDDLPHVFDRLWRADAARGRDTGGSGLGLAIARRLVIDQGGRIEAASEIGAGTTMTITLPLRSS
ncbi:ATP-binding protein [Dactylosporangium sp. AC04546]|uniref:sensor histidine kinase n=1 Tax=Dactylosporangium sp. AC04546 TaxID=2862460 RepID=UPI001EE085D2|nr:ATP-binding protein [Dactylosporangium sp. AC04546]WVK87047.1 ATP-binding protein [Dactylosporangium sp. AC04546]